MKRVCVFMGSKLGVNTDYLLQTKQLAAEIVNRNLELVYGGAKIGLMGVLADEVLEQNGHVIGVIPECLTQKEIVHDGLSELHIVTSMHERKAKMAELASGFITLPGGIGTLEETCEILTWAQLGIHKKPCGLLNVAGYYDPFILCLDTMVEQGFLKSVYRLLMIVEDDSAKLLDKLESFQSIDFMQWMKEENS